MANVFSLIDPAGVYTSAMGDPMPEVPLSRRPLGPAKGTVLATYPVGHPDNPSGQLLVDVQCLNGLPLLYRVPVAHTHAYEDTEPQAPVSERRNPVDQKARNRMEGARGDLRPGTFVWVSFLDGSIFNPVVTATIGFNQKPDYVATAPTYAQSVDRIGADGAVTPAPTRPVEGDMQTFPRKVDVYNGVRDEVDNTGSRYIQTSVDREPVWKGHNQIDPAPDPQGNFGVSTRGAVVGNIRFTTGRAPETDSQSALTGSVRSGDDEKHTGRMERVAMQADDGTIRDETDSQVGAIVHKSSGPAWTKGASVYMEGDRAYVKLTGDADIYGDTGTINTGTVKLGGPGMGDEIVLWPQLCQVIEALCQLYDQHRHGGVQSGTSFTDAPIAKQTPIFEAGKDSFKAADVLAGPSASPQSAAQDDPDDKRKARAR